jgi:hypothetical protein
MPYNDRTLEWIAPNDGRYNDHDDPFLYDDDEEEEEEEMTTAEKTLTIDEYDEHNEALIKAKAFPNGGTGAFEIVDLTIYDRLGMLTAAGYKTRALAFGQLRIVFFPQGEFEYGVYGPAGEPVAEFVRGQDAITFVIGAFGKFGS